MKNLFIDTNVYLTFYHFSSDDLEELKKLRVAVQQKRINLYITEQVINEFRRNRESKIADAMKRFTDQKLPDQFPQICKVHEEYNQLREILKSFEITRDQLLVKLKSDIDDKKCGADAVIHELFEAGTKLIIDEAIINKAKTRMALGNPPGKNDSLGDVINWELLIQSNPVGEDLHLVTDDQDYVSKIDKGKLAEYLDYEWKEKQNSSLYFYSKLSEFLRSEFPDIRLATELEKELAINDFINSPSFKSTHRAIKKLLNFTEFSDTETSSVIEASVKNRQIYWLREDDDVKSFLINIIDGREDIIDPDILETFNQVYREDALEEDNLDEIQL